MNNSEIRKLFNSDPLNQNNYSIVQTNGRRVFGPPLDWEGPPPSDKCELFISSLPRTVFEIDLLPHFERFGKIYDLRLMMNYNNLNRGFCYIKYICEIDSLRALEVMKHFYIQTGKLLKINLSYNKKRLFVGNLPKELPQNVIKETFKKIYPKVENIIIHSDNKVNTNKNRGFIFLDFDSHNSALEAKKQSSPGLLRLWDRDIKITWAIPERLNEQSTLDNVKTIYIRNIDLSTKRGELYILLNSIIRKANIGKITIIREFAFVEFIDRASAEFVLNILNGKQFKGNQLQVEWAIPPSNNSIHNLKNVDFDAILRTKCIANYWNVPIIIFGRIFESENLQYISITINSETKNATIYMEISLLGLFDIQSRACEVIVLLIDQLGGLPTKNYVFKVESNIAHLIGVVINEDSLPLFVKANNINFNLYLYIDELIQLAETVNYISKIPQRDLLQYYNTRYACKSGVYMQYIIACDRLLGCIDYRYRNKLPLKYNIDNSQIIFALCDLKHGTNFTFDYNIANTLIDFQNYVDMLSIDYKHINLLPLNIIQFKRNVNCIGVRVDLCIKS